MNKYQRQLNKKTQIQVTSNINKSFPNTINVYQVLNSPPDFGHILYNIEKSFKYTYMISDSYFYKIRRQIKKKQKQNE